MAELIDSIELSSHQVVDVREGGEVWIHDNRTFQDIQLDALAATKLYDFLQLHMDRLHHHAKVIRYNREMDERNRIARENIDKPWLPLHDGE